MLRLIVAAMLLTLLHVSALAAPAYIWVEGENTAHQRVISNPGFDAVDTDELSGGKWLSGFANKGEPEGIADYSVRTAAETYHMWLRGAAGTGLSWRWDNAGDWRVVDASKAVQLSPASAAGGDLWPAVAWYDLGTVALAAGQHTLAFDLGGSAGDKRFAGIDCFILSRDPFTPDGKYPPGKHATDLITFAPGSAWDFKPAADTLDPSALLDLRYLNETTAGAHGFIKTSRDGDNFVRGDGQPVRFWAESEYAQETLDMPALRRHAQFLAKRGVNLVRVHTQVCPKNEGSQITDFDAPAIDNIYKLVAAMKSAGIYTVISPYWAPHVTLQKSWHVPNPGHDDASAMIFFDPTLQRGYRAWMKALYSRPNPYTGIPLSAEPAVEIIQLQNEDSMLWWGLSNLQGDALVELRKQFASFLISKYGSLSGAQTAWKNYKSEYMPDDWEHGLPGFLHVWDLTHMGFDKKGSVPGFKERSADMTEFLAKKMAAFNAGMVAYLRTDLGCKQLVNAGNWSTVDLQTTQDAEYWSYATADVLARNNYTGGLHNGVNNGWQVVPTSYYTDVSMTKQPVDLPTNVKRLSGHPFIIPETLWVPPDQYAAEGPLMTAAQQSLTGVNASFWFCNGVAEWDDNPLAKWVISTPTTLGQFPAAALMFRKGYVQRGSPVVVEQRSNADIFNRTTPVIAEKTGWDPNHNAGNMAPTSSVKTPIDPLAYLVGPVEAVYGGDPAKTYVADLAKYIDRGGKTVHSITGQITTDYGRGIYTVNAPFAQAAAGFLSGAGTVKLADVTIACKNRYASIVVVPLDSKMLTQSHKVLIQVGTVNRPTGWTVRPAHMLNGTTRVDAFRVISSGKAPYQVEKTDAVITIAGRSLGRATALDANGMPMGEVVKTARRGDSIAVTMPPDALYVVVQ